jgi:hypothetical protein
MTTSIAAYGANLAVLALTAAKAAGDALAQSVAVGIADKVPGVTEIAVTDFFDMIPAAYRSEVRVLFEPSILAAKTAVDAALADRIHTGIAIAQAAADNRIAALQATLAATPAAPPTAAIAAGVATGVVLGASKGLRAL